MSESPNPRPRRQHYIPQFYLKGFVGEVPSGHIWTYDCLEDRWYSALPRNTAVESNIYSYADLDGRPNDDLERIFSEIESKASAILPTLIDGHIPQGQDRADFAMFLATMYVRTPARLRVQGEMLGAVIQKIVNVASHTRERFEQSFIEFGRRNGREYTEEEIDMYYEFIRDKSKYSLSVLRDAALVSVGACDAISSTFARMRWCVVASPSQHLISSDNPLVVVSDPRTNHAIYGDGGLMNKSIFVTLPLSASVCLEMTWGREISSGLIRVKGQRGRFYNRQRAGFSERYLYSSRKDYGIRMLGQKHRDQQIGLDVDGVGELAEINVVRSLKQDR